MTIDIRAVCRCNLGELIEASIVDDYIQGQGLVTTRGNCEIKGLISPAIGSTVVFQYTKRGVTRTVPRKLRVLSSFADPFRRTTAVELGCKLTYLEDLTDPINWSAYDDPFNDSEDPEERKIVVLPIYAKSIAEKCLTELGIKASSMPLTNAFSVPNFDFSSGYTTILGNLLVSEGYFGYLDSGEALQVRRIGDGATGGPVLSRETLVDIAPIGVGQLPAESVVVSYNTLKLKDPDPEEDDADSVEKRDWEFDSTLGLRTSVDVVVEDFPVYETGFNTFDPAAGRWTYITKTVSFTYYPYSETRTYYDEWDRVTKKVTIERSIAAAFNTEPISQALNAIKAQPLNNSIAVPTGWGNSPVEVETTTTYKYKMEVSGDEKIEGYDEIEEEVTEKWGPTAAALGGTTVKYWVGSGTIYRITRLIIWLPPTNDRVLIERTIRQYENNARRLTVLSVDSDGNLSSKRNLGNFPVSKIRTIYYKIYANSPQGQQAMATYFSGAQVANTQDPEHVPRGYDNPAAPASVAKGLALVYVGTDVSYKSGREATLEVRASAEEQALAQLSDGGDPNNGYQTPSVASLELALGSAAAQRRIEFSLPYAPDDIFTRNGDGTFSSVQSDAEAKARAFGRVQNRLLFGNRNGISIQAEPERVPESPMAPLYVSTNGRTVMYRTNAMSWTLDSSGIVVGIDAIHWGQASQ